MEKSESSKKMDEKIPYYTEQLALGVDLKDVLKMAMMDGAIISADRNKEAEDAKEQTESDRAFPRPFGAKGG